MVLCTFGIKRVANRPHLRALKNPLPKIRKTSATGVHKTIRAPAPDIDVNPSAGAFMPPITLFEHFPSVLFQLLQNFSTTQTKCSESHVEDFGALRFYLSIYNPLKIQTHNIPIRAVSSTHRYASGLRKPY